LFRILIRITHSSICGSDLNILKGRIVLEENGIMGHEGCGIVEKVGPEVKRVKPGDRVGHILLGAMRRV